jgi:hypothetical protein
MQESEVGRRLGTEWRSQIRGGSASIWLIGYFEKA